MTLPVELDHWHPVYLSRKLGKRPVAIKVCGVELALFRTKEGVAALLDRCPHRAMRLSKGRVKGNCVECPYHGWQFDAEGKGTSPGTPKLRPEATHLACVEENGAIWVKNPSSNAELPRPNVGDFHLGSLHHHRFHAPLELVLDNFHEVEHTATVHTFLGVSLEKMHEVQVSVEADGELVRMMSNGPQKAVPRIVQALFGVYTEDRFIDVTTTRFAPCYSVFDLHWEDPKTGKHRAEHVRSVTFYTPIDANTTDIISFAYVKQPTTGRFGVNALMAFVNRLAVDLEFWQDTRMLDGLADLSTELSGFRLGRFDKVLSELRRGVRRYRQKQTHLLPVLPDDSVQAREQSPQPELAAD